MGEPVTISLRHLARGLGLPSRQVQAVLELLDEGNTVPFITRYRKDRTGGLDEEQIRQVQVRLAKLRFLADRKQTILRSIESQGKLTEKLAKEILAATTTKRLEDLYLPYKPKKQTLATLAHSRGLELLATEILEAPAGCSNLDARAADFINSDRQVPTAADALLGAGHILAEMFSERADLRQRLREILQRTGKLVSTRVGGEAKQAAAGAGRPAGDVAALPAGDVAGLPAGDVAGLPTEPPPADVAALPAGDVAVRPAGDVAGLPTEPPPADAAVLPAGDVAGLPTEPPPADVAVLPAEPQPPPEVSQLAETGAEPEPREEPPQAGSGPDCAESPSDGIPPSELGSGQGGGDADEESPVESVVGHVPDVPGNASGPADADTSPQSIAELEGPKAEEPPSPFAADLAAEAPATGAQASTAAPGPPPAPPQQAARRPPKPSAADRKRRKKEQRNRQEQKRHKAFSDYFEYREELRKIPPHRVLAINRGERARVLRVKLEADLEAMYQVLEESCVPPGHPHAEFLRGCARDALTRLILPSLDREIRRELTERAEAHAVAVFAKNLRNLLLQPPVRDRRVLAIDPGFKSGCKLVALDQFGNPLANAVIFLVGKPERRQEARKAVVEMVEAHQVSVIAIGNGTACREAERFVADLLGGELKDKGVVYVIVNEAGASVYSTSHIGRDELPNCDATLRGAISIGRRLEDPLSELVKIDPANIGVGLYQHDVKAKHLRASLDEVVESCVNYVGVDVNTASPALLGYVSGLNQLTARRLYEHRRQNGPFRGRPQLREVPGIGDATFVQAAGFLKIAGGDNPLDATWIHPESYEIAGRVMEKLGISPAELTASEAAGNLAERVAKADVKALASELGVGELLLKDILAQLARPGRDPREDFPPPVFKHGVVKLEDLAPGMELNGTVLNVVDFGAFVDIGMHDSGLVHVSQMADRFVRDPHEVVAVGDIVRVWVVEVDKQRRRVSLTMIPPGTRRAPPRREGKPEGRAAPGRPAGPRPPRSPRPAPAPPAQEASGVQAPATGAGAQRPQPYRPPRSDRKGRREGGPRPGGRGPQGRLQYKPKPRPKPVVPITDAMKSGKEPMRSFSDLMQFYVAKEGAQAGKPPGEDPRKKRPGPPPPVASEAPAPPPAEAPPAEPAALQDRAPPAQPAPPAEPAPSPAAEPAPSPAPSDARAPATPPDTQSNPP